MIGPDSAKILIVDDLAAQRLATETALAELGAHVIAVDSGSAALRLLLEQEFAVVLLDVNMPDIDGFETAALIRRRARSQHTPIIFLTADSDEIRAAHGYSLGAVDYIVCPFAPEVLRAKVRVFVELSRAQERLRRDAEQRVTLSREQAARAAAEDESRRLRVLADVSGMLTRSLDASTLAGDLLSILIPGLADLGAIVLCERGPRAHTNWLGAGAPPPELEAALDAVITRGVEVLEPPDAAAAPHGAVLPLTAQGRLLGALVLAMTESPRSFARADLDLLRVIASRAAVALENCRLYQEIQARDRQKDEFLAMISHELRNPLGAIANAVNLLDLIGQPDERAVRARAIIRRQSSHLTRIVDDLLDVTRLAGGGFAVTRSPLRLDELVERTVRVLREAGRFDHHRLVVRADPVTIDADSTRIEQVITNLIVNAIKYTDRNGRIEVDVGVEGEEAVLRVRDSGVGIGAELLPSLFDLFVQGAQTLDRSQGGLGVGLTLVRKLVELHDGRVEATSAGPGAGSVFTVRLPRAAGPSLAPRLSGSFAAATGEALRVLVVEDNADARAMLRAMLEHRGHDVCEVADGLQALALALALRPQVAIIDLGLPGLDGLQVAHGIRAAEGGDEMILVALTGYGQPSDRLKTREAGFDIHLVKPLDHRRLAEVLAAAAGATGQPAEVHSVRQSLRASYS